MEESNLNDVMKIFKQIEGTSGKNDKVLIILRNKDNKLFKYFLNFLYDETITTGLSDKKINKEIKFEGVSTFRGFDTPEDIMDWLSESNTGTDKIIYTVQSYLRNLPEEEQDFLKQVFTKSYKCGITSSSVNKAIPNLIKEFKVQLANSYAKVADKFKGEFALTIKLDGHRTLTEVRDGRIIFRTRKGHQILGMNELEEQLKAVFSILGEDEFKDGIVLDGEVTIADESTPKEKVFQETSKIIRKDGEKKGLRYHIFDVIPYNDFLNGESEEKYNQRRETLNHIFNSYEYNFGSHGYNFDLIELLPVLYQGKDKDIIPELMKKATNKGEEGLIINTNVTYKCKRHNGLLKVKEFFSADVEVTGYEVGTGRLSDTLGALVLDFDGYEVKLGTGFSDQDRKEIWEDKENVAGKIVQVDYFEITSNQKGGKSLRFPSYKGFRDLKTKEDINIES